MLSLNKNLKIFFCTNAQTVNTSSTHKQDHKVHKTIDNRMSFFIAKSHEKSRRVQNDGKSAKVGDGNCGVTGQTRRKEDGEGGG